jgi:hypothetical protein
LFVSEEDGFRIGLPKQGSYWGAETQADRNRHNYAREGDQLMLKNVDMRHFAKWPKESNAQMKCDMRIMHAIVKGDLSFNVVEQEWFQELIGLSQTSNFRCWFATSSLKSTTSLPMNSQHAAQFV